MFVCVSPGMRERERGGVGTKMKFRIRREIRGRIIGFHGDGEWGEIRGRRG